MSCAVLNKLFRLSGKLKINVPGVNVFCLHSSESDRFYHKFTDGVIVRRNRNIYLRKFVVTCLVGFYGSFSGQ